MRNNERETRPYTPPVAKETMKEPVNETEVAVVTGCENLNVRKGPGLNYAIVCMIPAGTVLVVLNDSPEGDFYHICTENGVKGYCMKKYVTIQQ